MFFRDTKKAEENKDKEHIPFQKKAGKEITGNYEGQKKRTLLCNELTYVGNQIHNQGAYTSLHTLENGLDGVIVGAEGVSYRYHGEYEKRRKQCAYTTDYKSIPF